MKAGVFMEYLNLSRAELIKKSLQTEDVQLSDHGSLCFNTGKYTGRAPEDKFIVCDSQTIDIVNWNKNKTFEPAHFDNLYGRVLAYLQDKDIFVQNLYAGSTIKLPFKLTTTSPKHAAASLNLFYKSEDLQTQFEILHVPSFKAIPNIDNTNSEVFIVINFSKRIVLIGGTDYFGEIKKSIFTIMNFILPQLNVLPMHSSVNEYFGSSSVFFGLSGTGKTTLSADKTKTLVGDDEHGWGDSGLFNFENGCYAKTINLSKKSEPEIWSAVNKFGAILENVELNNGKIDFNSNKITENTRASYQLSEIENSSITRTAKHPKNIIMLAYDAYGVLPEVSKLNVGQAGYYFLNGYTCKVAGTELGVKESTVVFSACFGEPFLPLHPLHYTKMFLEKIKKHNVNVYLVNTGLIGGGLNVGKRVELLKTREIIQNIHFGTYEGVNLETHDKFKTLVPHKNGWENKQNYNDACDQLIEKFRSNFKKYNIKDIPQEVLEEAL